MSKQPAVIIPTGVSLQSPNLKLTPQSSKTGSFSGITMSGVRPHIPGGPVVQAHRVAGTFVQVT